jgi:hypothetical protein
MIRRLLVIALFGALGSVFAPLYAQDDPTPMQDFQHPTTGGTLTIALPPDWSVRTVADDPDFYLTNPDATYEMALLAEPLPYFRRVLGINTTIADVLAFNDDAFTADPDVRTDLRYDTDLTINNAVITQRLVQVIETIQRIDGTVERRSYFSGVGFLAPSDGSLYFYTVLGPQQDALQPFLARHAEALTALSLSRYTPPPTPTINTDTSTIAPDLRINQTAADTPYTSPDGALAVQLPADWAIDVTAEGPTRLEATINDAAGRFRVQLSYVAPRTLTRLGFDPDADVDLLLERVLPLLTQDAYFARRFAVQVQTSIERFTLNDTPYAEVVVFYTEANTPHIDAFGLLRVGEGVLLVTSTLFESHDIVAFETQQGIVRGVLAEVVLFGAE